MSEIHKPKVQIPEKMKVAIFTGVEQMEFRTVDVPTPAADEILVKMRSCAICTWDQRAYLGINNIAYPFVGGHEIMATVVEPGRNISSVSRGDDIALGLMSACGDCYYCRMGQEGVCEQFDYNRKVGRLPFSGTGGFSEYLSVKERNIFKFSRSVDPGVGAFSEPLSCVHHSIGLIGEKRYKTAVVIGAGTMGLLHILMLKNRVEQIIVSDPSEQRRATALKLGADAGINPDTQDPVKVVRGMTEGRGADVIIDATPVFSIAQDILDMVAPMGTVIYYSSIYPKEHVQLDPNRIHKSMANITGSANSNTHDFSQAVELLSTQEIDPTPLVSAQFQFEDIKEAFTVSLRHDNYRTVIRFS